MKLGLFASGRGSNVMAILSAIDQGKLEAQAVALVTDNPQAGVLDKVKDRKIPTFIGRPKDFPNRQAWEQAMVDFLQAQGVDLVVLAGFMRIIGPSLLDAYPDRILNIHPSLLPAFPGRRGIEDAYEAGVSQTGVTVHYVDQGIDTGQIIVQESLSIPTGMTLEALETAIHQIEHRLYPAAIQSVINKLQREEMKA